MTRHGWRSSLVLLAVSIVPAAAGLDGIWSVEDGEAKIEVRTCGDDLCGRIVWLDEPTDSEGNVKTDIFNPDAALRERAVVGLDLLRLPGPPDGQSVWRGGRIYDPKSGKTYRCTVKLENGQLKLRGFIGIRLFGRSTYWRRSTL